MAQYKTFETYVSDENNKILKQNDVSKVHHIKSSLDRDTLIKNNNVVVIDNYTDWCGPCRDCAPKFSHLADQLSFTGLCAFGKENAEDDLGGLPIQINGVPSFHFYVNGVFQSEMVVSGADIDAVEKILIKLLR